MDPYNEIDRNRLATAVESSYRSLEWARNLVRNLVDDYVGPGYGQPGGRTRYDTIVNLIHQTVEAYTKALASNLPNVLVTTPHSELEFFGKRLQVATNNLIKEIRLDETINRWVMDGFFCVGIAKVHLADSGQVIIEDDIAMDPGIPYVSNVSIDNWVHDEGALQYRQCRFAGDSYRIPFDSLYSDVYNQDVVKDLRPTTKFGGDEQRLEDYAKQHTVDQDEFQPMIDLCDLWIPDTGKIWTFPLDGTSLFKIKGPPVAEMDWDGPEFGPYHLIGFGEVPDNIMPTSMAAQLRELFKIVNNVMRKQAKRARNMKMNHAYPRDSVDSAKTLQNAGDGEWVGVDEPDKIKTVVTGGVDQVGMAFVEGSIGLFDRAAGNLPAIAGLGTQADTLGQEELIHTAASGKMAAMASRVTKGTTAIVRDLAHLLFIDKFKVIPGSLPIEGAEGYSFDMTWTPDMREGDFLDYNFTIDVDAMGYRSRAQRLKGLLELLNGLFLPGSQILQQQQGFIDFQAITEDLAELADEPRIKRWIKFLSGLPQPEVGPQGMEPRMAAQTTRRYVRENKPTGGTMESQRSIRQQMWMNQAVSPQQASTMSQPPV